MNLDSAADDGESAQVLNSLSKSSESGAGAHVDRAVVERAIVCLFRWTSGSTAFSCLKPRTANLCAACIKHCLHRARSQNGFAVYFVYVKKPSLFAFGSLQPNTSHVKTMPP